VIRVRDSVLFSEVAALGSKTIHEIHEAEFWLVQFRVISWIVLSERDTNQTKTLSRKGRSFSIFARPRLLSVITFVAIKFSGTRLLNVWLRLMAVLLFRAGKRLAGSV
jgi:hypothetical protein